MLFAFFAKNVDAVTATFYQLEFQLNVWFAKTWAGQCLRGCTGNTLEHEEGKVSKAHGDYRAGHAWW